jgi:hypothetical protein
LPGCPQQTNLVNSYRTACERCALIRLMAGVAASECKPIRARAQYVAPSAATPTPIDIRRTSISRGHAIARTTAAVSTRITATVRTSCYIFGLARTNATRVREFQNTRRCSSWLLLFPLLALPQPGTRSGWWLVALCSHFSCPQAGTISPKNIWSCVVASPLGPARDQNKRKDSSTGTTRDCGDEQRPPNRHDNDTTTHTAVRLGPYTAVMPAERLRARGDSAPAHAEGPLWDCPRGNAAKPPLARGNWLLAPRAKKILGVGGKSKEARVLYWIAS